MLEVFRKQKVFRLPIHRYFILSVKESITQIPYPQSLICKILVLDLFQTSASQVFLDIGPSQFVGIYQMIMNIDFKRKAMRFTYVVQYREVYDKQFLVKIDHLLFVDGFNIDRSITLYKSW